MIVYHYQDIDSWVEGQQSPFLQPRTSLTGIFFKGVRRKAIFALPDPAPATWVDNSLFPTAWEDLKKHMGKMLTEITLDPSDRVLVLDQAHVYLPEGALLGKLSFEVVSQEREQADKKYWDTRIPLEQYLEDPSKISLPEIIILNPIPRERVRISTQQPLIEEVIARAMENGNTRRSQKLLDQLNLGIPELQPWLEPCEAAVRPVNPHKERM